MVIYTNDFTHIEFMIIIGWVRSTRNANRLLVILGRHIYVISLFFPSHLLFSFIFILIIFLISNLCIWKAKISGSLKYIFKYTYIAFPFSLLFFDISFSFTLSPSGINKLRSYLESRLSITNRVMDLIYPPSNHLRALGTLN